MEWQRELRSIVRGTPGNEVCVDCREPNPTWASCNLGVFMCLDCSGIHRAMGVHISFVKSTTLDKWTPQLLSNMRNGGNKRANAFFEATMPEGYPRPRTMNERESFIRDKYERRKWVSSGDPAQAVANSSIPALTTHSSSSDSQVRSSSGKKKRIPPAQRRAMQQKEAEEKAKAAVASNDQVNLLGASEATPMNSSQGELLDMLSTSNGNVGGNSAASPTPSPQMSSMFSNMQIKVKAPVPSTPVEPDLVSFSPTETARNGNATDNADFGSFLDRFGIQSAAAVASPEENGTGRTGHAAQAANAIDIMSNFNPASSAAQIQQRHSPPSEDLISGQAPLESTTLIESSLGQETSEASQLTVIEEELAQIKSELEQAKINLQTYIATKQTLEASKNRLEQLAGHVDELQMSRLDALHGLPHDMLSRRKQLNVEATAAASQIKLVHASMAQALKPS